MKSCQIHLLMFCRAWLGHFPITGDTQNSVCDRIFTWADISFNRNSVWTFAHSKRADSIKNIGNLMGRQLSLSGRGRLFLSLRKHEHTIDRAKQNHLTSDGAGDWGKYVWAHTHTQAQTHKANQDIFPRLAENGICRRGKLKPKKNLGWEHRLSIMKQWQEITFYWVYNEWLLGACSF